MQYTDLTCTEFISAIAGKEPVPGGGSVAALVGALELLWEIWWALLP